VNVRFEHDGVCGRITFEAHEAAHPVICLPEGSWATGVERGHNSAAAATVLKPLSLAQGLIALEGGGVFLCAEPDGRITLSRKECRAWEHFVLSAVPNSVEVFDALGLLTPYDVSTFSKRRIGSACDGGYVLLDDFEHVSAIYSVGIGTEISFDEEFADMGKHVFMFDHTIDKPPRTHDNFHFFKQGIAAITDPSRAVYTIEHQIRSLGHEGGSDLLLKIDVEGAEFDVFPTMSLDTLRHFRQIALEIHDLFKLSEPNYRSRFVAALSNINNLFTLFHVHANNWAGIGFVEGFLIADILELSFVRSDLVVRTPNKTIYPTAYDFPNQSPRPDYLLWFYPFFPVVDGVTGSRGNELVKSLAISNRMLVRLQHE
jgi:hypothetical protein